MVRKTSENKRVTLVDVGREANVSAITVSRCIREPEKVSPKARERIEAAIARLGYVPDQAASTLASGRTNVVGLIVPSLTNAVFADVIRGIYDALEDSNLSLQIGNSRYSPSKEEVLIRTFLRQKLSGLIVSGIDQTQQARSELSEAECPIVQIMDIGPDPIGHQIGFSHFDATVDAIEHLIACGYRKPGLIAARMDPRSQARVAGFRHTAERHGLLDPTRILTTPQSSSTGLGGQLLSDLLARAPDTDAVFCNNDDLAAGALFEAQRRNIPVPQQLGICGFNDLEMSAHLNPPLTSVATPRYQIGYNAIELIRSALNKGAHAQPRQQYLPTEIVVRQTTR
ncbi:transcriptional regulator, LacI family [Rhodobacteraceae bacterium KLH11]|nr:transcriptional regulator, LacI family [Rhodobacteraceae bacterium KLH11]